MISRKIFEPDCVLEYFSIVWWEIQDFSVIQILREINFGESRSSKNALFAILGALYLVNQVNFSLQKVQNIHEIQHPEPPNVLKWQILSF